MYRIATVALSSLLVTPAALACSCMYGPSQALPNGTDGVATSASVLVEYNYVDSASEVDLVFIEVDSGLEVPHTVEDTAQGDVLIRKLVPDEPLSPDTDYAVYENWDNGSEPWHIAEFTTGTEADTEAPPDSAILKARSHRDRGSDAACGGGVRMDIEIEAAEKGALYEIEVTREDGKLQTFTFLTSEWLMLGHGGCTSNMPNLKASENVDLRIRALDVSGNAGTWSNPIQNTHAVLSGCSSVGSAGMVSGWMTLIALLGIRRRQM